MSAFTALSDPTRRRIVELLAARELTAGEIAGRFSCTPSAISQHLKVLREARLVSVRADGQHRIHSLNPAGIDEIAGWIERMRRFWDARLDALERELHAEDRRKKPSRK